MRRLEKKCLALLSHGTGPLAPIPDPVPAKLAALGMSLLRQKKRADTEPLLRECLGQVTNAPPAGRHFVTYEGLPSDYYLRLTGAATRMIRGETPLSEWIPEKLAERKNWAGRRGQLHAAL